MKNTSEDLCNHLFEQIERLNDDDLKGDALDQEIKRATAMRGLADGVIQTAKAETDRIKAVSDTGITSGSALLKGVEKKALANGGN